MKKIVPVLRMHWISDRFSFFIFWGVLLVLFLITVIPYYYATDSSVTVRANGSGAVIVYCFVVGILAASESLPFALGLNVRRIDYFNGTYLYFLLHSIAHLIILVLFSVVENSISKLWNVDFMYFNIFEFELENSGPIALYILLAFLIIFHQYSFGFALVSIYQRFGRIGLFILGTAAFLFLTLMTIFDGWSGLVPFFELFNSWHQFVIIMTPIFIILYALATYACIQRVIIRT